MSRRLIPPLAVVFWSLTLTVSQPQPAPFGEVGFGSAVMIAAVAPESADFLDSPHPSAYQARDLVTETV